MLANVSEPGCAENGVGDGVKDDVRVAVTGKASRMRNGDTAEHDRAVAFECVNVEPHAGARHQP